VLSDEDLGAKSFWLLLLSIVGLFFVVRLVLFVGIVGSDDASIASLALRLLDEGPFVPDSHYSARIGLIYPQALIFALFGVGEWQMAFLPLLASFGGLVLAYLIGKHYGGEKVGLLAALFVALFPLDAFSSSTLVPDLPLGALLALTFYLLIRAEQADSLLLALVAGLVWGWAYLIKVEAFFLLFVVLLMWGMRHLGFKVVFVCGLAVGAVVLTEHLVYYFASGDVSLRIKVATVQGGKMPDSELTATELWVFPKSWFLTPYYFGLHYYLLAVSLVWVVLGKHWRWLPLFAWVGVFLLWLQFGGNPFSDSYSVKSHLARYCNMLNVPMAVLIGLMLHSVAAKYGWRWFVVITAPALLLPLIFMPFNQLSAERQIATKKLLDIVKEQQLYPLNLDRTSLSLAKYYLYEDVQPGDLRSLQQHDFRNRQTKLADPEALQGYLLINPGFVEYSRIRYGVQAISEQDLNGRFIEHTRINNPLGPASYASARLLHWLAGWIPMEFFRNKIQKTAAELLQGNDAVLMKSG